ncbi:hypothetical protein ACT4MW_11990 [Pseudomonas brassicacearum subsp. neoaurantiaca]
MRLASVPVDPARGMRRKMLSQSSTSRIDEHGRCTANSKSRY